MRFLKGFLGFIGFCGVLVALGFILDATIPEVHSWFLDAGNWVTALFKK